MSNLRQVGLEGAAQGPGLHVLRDEPLLSEHVQTETFPGLAQVSVDLLVVLW